MKVIKSIDFEAIEARVNAATPGLWHANLCEWGCDFILSRTDVIANRMFAERGNFNRHFCVELLFLTNMTMTLEDYTIGEDSDEGLD